MKVIKKLKNLYKAGVKEDWIQQGSGAGVPEPIGDPYGDHDWELEQVLGTCCEEDAKLLCILHNTMPEYLTLLSALNEWYDTKNPLKDVCSYDSRRIVIEDLQAAESKVEVAFLELVNTLSAELV